MATTNRTGNGSGPGNLPPVGNNPITKADSGGARITTCSFCGKSSRDVGPMVEGPSEVYICANCVDLAHNIIRQEKRKFSASQPLFSTIPSPRQIKEFLDQYVVGQNPCQKGPGRRRAQPLQAADHFPQSPAHRRGCRIRPARQRRRDREEQRPAGRPDRRGKTLLARTLARILDVPFAISDATTLTEAGYVGEDVEKMSPQAAAERQLRREARRMRDHLHRRNRQDRPDHRERLHHPRRLGRGRPAGPPQDPGGDGVQRAAPGRAQAPEPAIHPDQHDEILFICGGAFVGLEQIIKKRLGQQQIGFNSETTASRNLPRPGRILAQVQPEDLVEFGMIPEFVGRLPVVATLDPLDMKVLINILTEPKNALVKQFQKFFRIEGSELEFTPGASS